MKLTPNDPPALLDDGNVRGQTGRKSTILGTTKGELVLRVLGPQYHGRTLRLRAPKCTIGSGPHCTLRLRAHGVRDVHCLILRGRAGTFVRRWAPDTCLNDAAFAEAPLKAGDRLHIGPVELQVVNPGADAIDTTAEPCHAPMPEHRDLPEPLPDTAMELNAALAEARAELEQARKQHARDLEKLQTLEGELERSQQQLAAAGAARQQDEADRAQQRAALQQQIDALTEQNQQLEMKQAALQSDAERVAQALRAETVRLIEQLESANATIQEKARRIAELESRIALPSPPPAAADVPAPGFAPARPAGQSDLEDDMPRDAAPSAPAPPDEVARRGPRGTLVLDPDLQPQTLDNDAPPAIPEATDDPNAAATAPPPSADPQSHDTEIQSYMQRLLERVGGGQWHAAQETDPRAAGNGMPDPNSATPAERAETPSAAQAPNAAGADSQKPGVKAPESTDDLAVLRELANLNARTSLTKAARRRYIAAAVRELTMATGTLAVGCIALGLGGRPFSGLWLTGLIGLGTGAFMTVRGLRYVGQLRPRPRTAKMSSKSRK